MNVLVFLGQPIVAVGLGLIVAILTLGRSLDRHEALTEMEKGMASAGIIMLVTGGGGALGQIKPSFVCRECKGTNILCYLVNEMPACYHKYRKKEGTGVL